MIRYFTAALLLLTTAYFSSPAQAAFQDSSPGQPQKVATSSPPEALHVAAAYPTTSTSSGAAQWNIDFSTIATPSGDVDKLSTRYLKDYLGDTGKILASPLHWEAKDWLKLGGVLGAASSLFLIDAKVKDFAQSHQSPVASKFALVGNDLGNGLYTLPPIGAFYLYGYLADDHKARRASLLAVESFAISGLMTEGVKMLAERHRPNSGAGADTFDGPHLSLKNLSFSSGHTASSFSIATVFADVYKDNPYVPPIAYGLATLTGLSRIYSNEHWSSDVFVGAALGYFVSKAVLRLHQDHTGDALSRLTLFPSVSKEMTGISMKMEF